MSQRHLRKDSAADVQRRRKNPITVPLFESPAAAPRKAAAPVAQGPTDWIVMQRDLEATLAELSPGNPFRATIQALIQAAGENAARVQRGEAPVPLRFKCFGLEIQTGDCERVIARELADERML